MSRELRTPLNGIIGFSEFLMDERAGPLSATQKDYLNDVLTSGQHLLRLINDILDLSKIAAGRMEVLPEHFELTQAIEEVCSVVSPLARRKSIALQRRIAPDIPVDARDQARQIGRDYGIVGNVPGDDEGRQFGQIGFDWHEKSFPPAAGLRSRPH